MQSALWVSKTGLAAQDVKMTTIANNLANVNTTGFKRDRVAFNDLFYQTQRQPGGQVDELNELPSGLQLGTGTRVVGTQKIFTTGDMLTIVSPWVFTENTEIFLLEESLSPSMILTGTFRALSADVPTIVEKPGG